MLCVMFVYENVPSPLHSSPQHDSSFAVGDYLVAMDPIDGSKNIDASLPVGSIFGIYKAPTGKEVDESSFLQDGNNLVAAGYCLFS